jgi:nicotinamide riboside kinase
LKELHSQKRKVSGVLNLPDNFLTALNVFFNQNEGEKVVEPMEQLERLAWEDYSSEFVGRARPADVSSHKGDRLVVIDTNLHSM